MPLAEEFLTALVASFDSSPDVTAAIPGGIYSGSSNRSPEYPLCVIEAFEDGDPGECLEDKNINVTFVVKANQEADAKAAGAALMKWFDPNLIRPRLEWETGYEMTNLREGAELKRPNERAKHGARLWEYTIPYVFRVFDEVA